MQGALTGAKLKFATHAAIVASTTATGLLVDFASDLTARHGRVAIERDVILNAQDALRHCYSYYGRNTVHPVSKLLHQKHEWLVLESHSYKYYVVEKCPRTGDVAIAMRSTLRAANDVGLASAGLPIHTGETRLQRMDQDFDLPSDLQVAYVIAWLRKEDPRWALTTENSRHFAMRLRLALNDY